jgi:hypothetical protein
VEYSRSDGACLPDVRDQNHSSARAGSREAQCRRQFVKTNGWWFVGVSLLAMMASSYTASMQAAKIRIVRRYQLLTEELYITNVVGGVLCFKRTSRSSIPANNSLYSSCTVGPSCHYRRHHHFHQSSRGNRSLSLICPSRANASVCREIWDCHACGARGNKQRPLHVLSRIV